MRTSKGKELMANAITLIRDEKGGVATALPVSICGAPVTQKDGSNYLGISTVR